MRPDDAVDGGELYECYDCGKRIEAPDTRFCGVCGGELRNISRSRDL